MSPGLVSILGAGPGDPELLTLAAARRLAAAQAVVYDALVNPALLDLAPPQALRLFVGKRHGLHSQPQRRINAMLVRLARRGLRTVRLKGGDPFVFGRGAEEGAALTRAKIPWELVAGVSSCLAAPAAAGIPVTARGVSSMVTIVSGHQCARGAAAADWKRISPRATLVVLMGFSRLSEICIRLIKLGWPAATPAAALASMGWLEERVAVSDLRGLPEAAGRRRLASPAVIVVGAVVGLRRRLKGRRADQEESCQRLVAIPRAPARISPTPRSFPAMPPPSGRLGPDPRKSTPSTSSSVAFGTRN